MEIRKKLSNAEATMNQLSKFTVEVDLLFFGSRVYIPIPLQTKILHKLHEGHPGIQKMKGLARSYVYWPKIDVDIERFIRDCESCAYHARNPEKVAFHHWEEPSKPNQRIHIDHAGDKAGLHFF